MDTRAWPEIVFLWEYWYEYSMDKKSFSQTCRQYNSHYNEIEPFVYQMTRDDKIARKYLGEILQLDNDDDSQFQFPTRWFTDLAGQYVATNVMTDPQAISHLRRKYRDQLSDAAIGALDFWREHPYHWEFFEISQEHGDHFYTIRDVLSAEEKVLFSPGITGMQGMKETRECVYCTILFENGACNQTVGIIHSYHLTRKDIEFFCKTLDRLAFLEEHLNGVIKKKFLEFFKLDEISTIGFTYSNSEHIAFHWKTLEFSSVRDLVFPGKWETSSETFFREELLKLDFQGADAAVLKQVVVPDQLLAGKTPEEYWQPITMDIGSIFLNLDTGSVGVESLTLKSFQRLICILASVLPGIDPLACEPDWLVSPHLLSLTEQMEDFIPPWFNLREPFKHTHEEPGKNAQLARINQVLNGYLMAKNTGVPFDLEQACLDNGLQEDEARSIIQTLEENFAKKFKPLELSINDQALALSYPIPPPALLVHFGNDLNNSGVFETNDDDACYELFATLTNNSYASIVQLGGIGKFISSLFADEFGRTDGFHIMDGFFFLLLFLDGERLAVRVYALEILKLFHRDLLPSLGLSVEGFISRFSNFVYRKLCRCALILIDSRPSKEELSNGTYRIHSSEFFDDFLVPGTKLIDFI